MQSGQSMRGSSAQAIYSQRIELLVDGRFVSEPGVIGLDLILIYKSKSLTSLNAWHFTLIGIS